MLYNECIRVAGPVTQINAHCAGRRTDMDKYVCKVCGYVYDPEKGDPDNGIAPGTAFADLPDDWVCPLCGVPKSEFEKQA